MTRLSLAMALLLAAAPALAEPCRLETPEGEPCDLAALSAAPWAGTLTSADAWQTAARKRIELEQQIAELKAQPCGSPSVTTGLALGASLFVAGAILGVLLFRG